MPDAARANDTLGVRRRAALDRTDALPPALRAVVHDLGLPIVEAFVAAGVTNPRHMLHLAAMFWTCASGQDNARVGARRQLDVMLARHGGAPNAAMLARLLAQQNMAILHTEPTARMVRASLRALDGHGIVSREQKHRLRLKAALADGAAEVWPEVFGDAG